MQHLCNFVKDKYGFNMEFKEKHFQLGNALTSDINNDEFWDKDPFILL